MNTDDNTNFPENKTGVKSKMQKILLAIYFYLIKFLVCVFCQPRMIRIGISIRRITWNMNSFYFLYIENNNMKHCTVKLCHFNNCMLNDFNANCMLNDFNANCMLNDFNDNCMLNDFNGNCMFNEFNGNCLMIFYIK